MPRPFDSFIILAEMRTGSNFLESNLDQFPGLKCYGEAFNPHFIVAPNRDELFGITQAQRDRDPARLIAAMKRETQGIPGFRFFHDHDPRVFDMAMSDPRCAKVVLTRNVVESYVSHRIAQQTDQWKLGDLKNARTARVRFDPEGFERMLMARKAFQEQILRALQVSGQTAFYLDYEDIQNLDVINGLAKFLGETTQLTSFSGKTKKQNPQSLADKVTNFREMERALARIDHYDLGRLPNFEPRRGPIIPTWMASDSAGLLFMPVPGAASASVIDWLARHEGGDTGALTSGFTQKTLRQWKRRHPGHRSFTMISHPVARLHRAWCSHIVNDGPGAYLEIRKVLNRVYDIPLPDDGQGWDISRHREGFIRFAEWVAGNLNGQTSLRVDGAWASQGNIIQGFAQFLLPDHILREDELPEALGILADAPQPWAPPPPDTPFDLTEIYDEAVEKAVRQTFQRDYMLFGFGPWRG